MQKAVVAAVVVLCAVVVIAPAGLAAKPGNSPNAKLCQKGGWENWVRADQSEFANEQECVSYAAMGGTLTVPVGPTHDVHLDKAVTGGTAPSGTTDFTFTVECESGVDGTFDIAPDDGLVLVGDDVADDDLCTITEVATRGATSTSFVVTGGSVMSTTATSVTFSVDSEVSVVATNSFPDP